MAEMSLQDKTKKLKLTW